MAVTVALSIGQTQVSKTFQNATNQKVASIIDNYLIEQRLWNGINVLTNEEKLMLILNEFLSALQSKAQQKYVEDALETAITQARTNYGLD